MKNLNKIAEELFNQIRSRFSNVTLGDENAEVVNEPNTARYFDFVYSENDNSIGNVSVSLDEEEGLVVMFSNNFGEDVQDFQKDNWYSFLKELRTFAKKRLLNFEVRDINKSSLQRRDYKTLANNRSGEQTMAESKMYGTHKTSFQKVGNAKIAIKHTGTLDEGENRTKKIGAIYVENNQGEKFKYPFKHLAGARAMALHVSEGGHPFDDFGKHITSMSEELSNLRKFKTYMGRSSVMAESLAEHLGIVNERIANVKKTIQNLQKPNYYKETFENFVAEESVQVPEDVAANWIDQLTVKQFNEELKDVFPYIYKLIGESTKPQELTFEDIINEDDQRVKVLPGEKDLQMLAKRFSVPPAKMQQFMDDMIEVNGLDDVSLVGVKEVLVPSAYTGSDSSNIGSREVAPNGQVTGSTRGFDTDNDYFNPRAGHRDQPSHPENRGLSDAIEYAVETLMGQFADNLSLQVEGEIANTLAPAFKNIHMIGPEEKKMQAAMQKHKDDPIAMQDAIMDLYSDDPDFAAWINKKGRRSDTYQSFLKAIGESENEGNAFAHAVRQAKMNGKKKGDKIDGPDGDEITLEKDQKTPLGEFILSYFDKETGQFPKGPTAVLTMVEKNYGDEYVGPAKEFIERIDAKVAEVMGYREADDLLGEFNLGQKISNMMGRVKPQDLIDKAMDISNRYKALWDSGKVITPSVEGSEQFARKLIALYIELIEMSRTIQKFGGGNKTEINALQQRKLIVAASRQGGDAVRRLQNASKYEPKFIIDLVKQDIQTMGESQDVDESGLQYYTGKKKYGKDGMAALAQAGREGASEEELGRIKDKYKKESADILKLAGL